MIIHYKNYRNYMHIHMYIEKKKKQDLAFNDVHTIYMRLKEVMKYNEKSSHM